MLSRQHADVWVQRCKSAENNGKLELEEKVKIGL